MPQLTSYVSRFDEEVYWKISDIFNEQASRRAETDIGMNLFKTETTNLRTYRYQQLPSGGSPKLIAEWQDFPETVIKQGYYATYTQQHFADGMTITKDHYMFFTERWKEIAQMPQNLVRAAFNAIDQSLADVLNNGWSTTYTDTYGQTVTSTTPDWVALLSDSHYVVSGWTVFGNIIWSGWATSSWTVNPALTRATLVSARQQGSTFKDSAWILSPLTFKTLIVWPDQYDLAVRLVKSEYIPTSTYAGQNDVNTTLQDLTVLKRDRLTAWYRFLATEQIWDAIEVLFAQKPMLWETMILPKSLSRRYPCDFYYVIARKDAAQIFGSKGTWSA